MANQRDSDNSIGVGATLPAGLTTQGNNITSGEHRIMTRLLIIIWSVANILPCEHMEPGNMGGSMMSAII